LDPKQRRHLKKNHITFALKYKQENKTVMLQSTKTGITCYAA
jgi:hypothetical protein